MIGASLQPFLIKMNRNLIINRPKGIITDYGQLTEVKKGQTGYGILIENDGSIKGKRDVVSQIKEDIDNGYKFVIPDDFIVSAVFQKYGIKNANGRIYPEDVLKREVARYMEEKVDTKTAIGSLEHPESSALNGHDVTHRILDLRWEGHTLVGEMKLHLSPGLKRYGVCSTSGDLVASMILDDIVVGVSSRGTGGVVERFGTLYVDDTFSLCAFDVVMENSTPGAKIAMKSEDLRQYIESDETKKYKSPLSEKIEKINKIIKG